MAASKLQELIGNHSFQESEEVLEEYSRDYSFTPRLRPRAVVQPQSASEVQALIKWANQTSTPLVPISSGAPHFRGDTVPGMGGAVIVDLSRMNQILRIDARNRVAMVEPGVTFSELIPQLDQAGIRLNLPLLPRANKSVIGSMLEREPVIMPLYQWDAIDPLTCIEVVFGTGDFFRTGSAAGPGTLEEQWNSKQAQVNPMGPGQTDFARVVQGSQGTMGIVTWSTVRCELLPQLQKPFLAGSSNLEQLSQFIYRMLWLKSVDECLILNGANLAAMLARNPAEYTNLKNALPQWVFFFCLSGYEYFPEKRVAYQEKAMLETAQRYGILPVGTLAGVSASEVLRVLSRPSVEPYWKIRQQGNCQELFFLSTLDKAGKFIQVMREQAELVGWNTADIGIYLQPMVQGSSCYIEFDLFYNPQEKPAVAKVQALYSQASIALLNAGAFYSRPYGELADLAYRRDGETATALKKVKSIFDPKNILNPGKLCF